MNTMLNSLTELEIRVRDYVLSRSGNRRVAFDMVEAIDAGPNASGDLFKQNEEFLLFELVVDDVRRAGPGWVSPRRVQGALDLSLMTKAPKDKVRYSMALEQVADWFQDQTISGIRFRSFTPTPAVPIHGFTAYNGVINIDFEIHLTR